MSIQSPRVGDFFMHKILRIFVIKNIKFYLVYGSIFTTFE